MPVKINYRWKRDVDGGYSLILGVGAYIGSYQYVCDTWVQEVWSVSTARCPSVELKFSSESEAKTALIDRAKLELAGISPDLELGEEVEA